MIFKLTKEHLERIKKVSKKKSLSEILEKEKKKKRGEDGTDENLITDRNGIKPIRGHIRSLHKEKGAGLQVDLEEIQKNIEKHKDLWDLQSVEERQEEPSETEEINDARAFKAFIHNVKTGGFGGRKRKRSMGQMNLGEMAREIKHQEKDISHVEKLKRRLTLGRESGGTGITF
jgi:hypothetical protein